MSAKPHANCPVCRAKGMSMSNQDEPRTLDQINDSIRELGKSLPEESIVRARLCANVREGTLLRGILRIIGKLRNAKPVESDERKPA